MDRPIYKNRPIGSVDSLARALRVGVAELKNYAKCRDDLYDFFEIDKKDGSKREICSPKRELKFIQKRINRAVFENVEFPSYLFGGIKDRDYVKNANEHSYAKALITLDVRNFYPSITENQVKDIFKNFCKFPDEVVELLSKLTTLKGVVPQGACTSSNIANLVFFDIEHLLVKGLRDQKFIYTRLLDDISISSTTRVFGVKEQERIIRRVADMLHLRGMHLKNKKTKCVAKSNPESLMEITGLWINRGQPRIKREERIDIRKEVRRTENIFKLSRTSHEFHELFNRVSGRVGKIAHLRHSEATFSRSRLRGVLPHLGVDEQMHLVRQVRSLSTAKVEKRETLEYIGKYYKVLYLINILRRSNVRSAVQLQSKMDRCKPTTTVENIVYGGN